ncbi:MAG: ABC transporter substrate-binding protein [Phycisphaeraceae bacterium]
MIQRSTGEHRRRPAGPLRWFALVLALAPAIALTSCGQTDDGQTRVELWTLALSPTFDDYMHQVIADFEAEHPGVEVVWVDVPFDALDRKLVTAAAAGRSPDVVNFSDRQFSRYAALGAMHDLNGLLPGDPHAQYQRGALRILELDGELLALPWYLTTQVRLVNQGLLAEGGLSEDTLGRDWETLRRQARDYHEQTGGFLFSLRLGEDSILPTMMLQSGLALFAEQDGRLVARLASDEVVAYIRAWVACYNDGALPRSSATGGHQAVVEGFQNGRLATIQTGANMLNRVRDANPDVYEQTAVLPPLSGALGRSHIAVMPVGVMGKSDHPALAARLAWHLTKPANQTELARRSSVLPSTPASLADPHFNPGADQTSDRMVLARVLSARSLDDAVAFTPAVSAWPDMRLAFNEGMKRVLLNRADLRETLVEVQRQWNALLRAAPPASLDTVPRPEPVS